jgi:hypothetical protein
VRLAVAFFLGIFLGIFFATGFLDVFFLATGFLADGFLADGFLATGGLVGVDVLFDSQHFGDDFPFFNPTIVRAIINKTMYVVGLEIKV